MASSPCAMCLHFTHTHTNIENIVGLTLLFCLIGRLVNQLISTEIRLIRKRRLRIRDLILNTHNRIRRQRRRQRQVSLMRLFVLNSRGAALVVIKLFGAACACTCTRDVFTANSQSRETARAETKKKSYCIKVKLHHKTHQTFSYGHIYDVLRDFGVICWLVQYGCVRLTVILILNTD